MSAADRSREARLQHDVTRTLRHVAQRNAAEQSACESVTRGLDAQRRSLSSRLSREQRGVRDQLQRLHDEQRTVDLDTDDADDASSTQELLLQLSIDDVINPYPISTRSKNSDTGTDRSTASPFLSSEESGGLWAGDPEAISSVRRPRKPPCRQRFDQQHRLDRSRSLKERPSTALGSYGGDLRGPRGSLGGCDSGESTSPQSGGCSRQGSLKGLKESRRFLLSPLGSGPGVLTGARDSPRDCPLSQQGMRRWEGDGGGLEGNLEEGGEIEKRAEGAFKESTKPRRRAVSLKCKSLREEGFD